VPNGRLGRALLDHPGEEPPPLPLRGSLNGTTTAKGWGRPVEVEMREGKQKRAELVERVRGAVVAAALAGWEEASLAGLCGEGAFEAAVGRMRSVDLGALVDGEAPGAIIGG
jgi:hypothetical protein